jgi:hypothetical protein
MTDHRRTGETFVEFLMGVVAPIVGGIATIVMLQKFTSFPSWLCFLVGLPVGTILGWIAMLTVIIAVGFVSKSLWK